jgi:hypothetical protein
MPFNVSYLGDRLEEYSIEVETLLNDTSTGVSMAGLKESIELYKEEAKLFMGRLTGSAQNNTLLAEVVFRLSHHLCISHHPC